MLYIYIYIKIDITKYINLMPTMTKCKKKVFLRYLSEIMKMRNINIHKPEGDTR